MTDTDARDALRTALAIWCALGFVIGGGRCINSTTVNDRRGAA